MDDQKNVLDNGPFFHGTKAELNIGDVLEPQYLSNYQATPMIVRSPLSRSVPSGTGASSIHGLMSDQMVKPITQALSLPMTSRTNTFSIILMPLLAKRTKCRF